MLTRRRANLFQFGIGDETWGAYSLVDYPQIVLGMITIGALGLTWAASRSALWKVSLWIFHRANLSRSSGRPASGAR